MFDPINIKPLQMVVYPVENSIIPDSKTIAFLPSQLQAARRAGVPRKITDFLDEPFEGRRLELVEVLLGRREDKELIHGAS
jgi:hypothetical protein